MASLRERELEELKAHNAMLQNQLDSMRKVHGGHAVTVFAFITDGLSHCQQEADGDGPNARFYGAMLDTWRTALGLPPRPHVDIEVAKPHIEIAQA